MKRSITSELLLWQQRSDFKPLIVRGARQVGKSHAIEEFGAAYFDKVVTINFEKKASLIEIFAGDFDVKNIVARLEFAVGQRILPHKTLLFFDEIQRCPRAIMALRYFKEDAPEYRVIAAGSLLDFVLGEISFPVGRVSWLTMHPMTLVEFFWAIGEDMLAELIQHSPHLLDNVVHQKLMGLVKRFGIVGGMPEVVKKYCLTGSLLECQNSQRDLLETYQQDFSKYAPKARYPQLLQVIEQIPKHVGQQIKYSTLDPASRSQEVKEAVVLLERAQIIHRVSATSGQGLPLGAEASAKIFKEIFLDVGLMQTMCGINWQNISEAEDFTAINNGALAEQFVGQELLAIQKNVRELFYWRRDERSSRAEVDYVFAYQGFVAPIEVKSGARGHLKSLQLFCDTYYPKKAFVVSSRPFMKDGNMTFVPLYFLAGMVGQ